VGFNIPLDILQVILERIFSVNHLTATRKWSSQQIARVVLVNQIGNQITTQKPKQRLQKLFNIHKTEPKTK